MLEFETAIKAVTEAKEDERPFTEFKLDGRVMKAYNPDDGQLAMFLASIGRGQAASDKVAGAINFFCSVLDEDDATHIEVRLLDRHDPFGLEQVEEIMQGIIEEWGGRPTKSLSVSTQSPESDGPKLTPTTPTPTSSVSPFISS